MKDLPDIHYLILRYDNREENFGITPGTVQVEDHWIKFIFYDKGVGRATTQGLWWFKVSPVDPFS